jgi:hypothetical protein
VKRRTYRIADDGDVGAVTRLLSQCVQAGKVLRVTVEKWTKPRTLSQNSYYHAAVVATIAEDTGHSDREIHEILKGLFCPVRVLRVGDVEHQIRSTRLLNTVEMAGYIDQCIAWAATELGLMVPGPNEQMERT